MQQARAGGNVDQERAAEDSQTRHCDTLGTDAENTEAGDVAPSNGECPALVESSAPWEAGPCKPEEKIRIGFVHGMLEHEEKPLSRSSRVLKNAFDSDCLDWTELERDVVIWSVRRKKIDIGVLSLPSLAESEHGRNGDLNETEAVGLSLDPSEFSNVAVLPILPPAYSVVAFRGEEPGEEEKVAWRWISWLTDLFGPSWNFWLLGGLFALLGPILLSLCVPLLNYRFPIAWLWSVQGVKQLDTAVVSSAGIWGWLVRSNSGRVLGVVWVALALLVYQTLFDPKLELESHAEDPGDQEGWKDQAYMGALRAAYPNYNIQELRGERWMSCAEPHECLSDYQERRSRGLAGDSHALCFYADETNVDDLRFNTEIAAVPLFQAFLLPSGQSSSSRADKIKKALVDEMRAKKWHKSPWESCEARRKWASDEPLKAVD